MPFCFHKCHYCDFYSFVDKSDQQQAFIESLELELAVAARFVPPGELRTLFVGGGTPSLLRVDLWRRLLETLDRHFSLRNRGPESAAEFTVECNPETVTPELMNVLAAGGVNRVSIGAQSFDDRHLKTLERWHNPANVERAVDMAAQAGIARRSIDLIFGIPGQTLDEWRTDLDVALKIASRAHGLEHLSCYDLTYEPNTAMTKRLQRGEFTAIDESVEMAMFRLTRSVLAANGFDAYEVSNFARGAEAQCRHNLAYWRQEQWLACGPSASGHVAGWRWKNAPSLGEWMRGLESGGGFGPVQDVECPDPRRALAEWLMTGLRLREGVRIDDAIAAAGQLGRSEQLRNAARRSSSKGFLNAADGVWALSDEGVLVGDSVAAELMASLG